ncbi:MAG: FecR domain-containing protein [Spongiibacteraceae bacterium]
MTNELHLRHAPSITAEACAWIAQLETGKLTPEDLAAFREWMARSPAHRIEIRRLAKLSADINVLAGMAPVLEEVVKKHRSTIDKGYRQTWPKNFMIAVALLLVVVISGAYVGFFQEKSFFLAPALVITAVGEYREVTLSDGTVMALNTDTRVEVDYSNQRRKVRLLKGEAHFHVAHNPLRPFVVYAGEKSVRAVGTTFSVVNLPKKFGVMVVEGKVEVAETTVIHPSLPSAIKTKEVSLVPVSRPIQLAAGESVTYADSISKKTIEKVPQREIQRRLSWQDGFLDFSDTPLSDVVDELSRYTTMNIEIIDPELNKIKFGGIFRIDDLPGFFDVVQSNFHINVSYLANDTVQLSSDKNNSG